MIGKFTKGKTAIFIDAANIFYSQRTLKWRIDFKRLASYLRVEANVVGLCYYTGVIEKDAGQMAFLGKLKSFGYAVVTKELKLIKLPGGKVTSKGSLDVELALDAYMQRHLYETCVLFSGDSDFSYLLDVLKRDGKKVLVASTRGHISKELLDRAKYIDLRKLRGYTAIIKGPDRPAPEVR